VLFHRRMIMMKVSPCTIKPPYYMHDLRGLGHIVAGILCVLLDQCGFDPVGDRWRI